jgi:coxsackievirus/adenovirus receptor
MKITGINCRENTDENTNCKTCKSGFFGNPLIGVDIPCRACPCPGTPDSGIYHAQGCQLDKLTNGPICQVINLFLKIINGIKY